MQSDSDLAQVGHHKNRALVSVCLHLPLLCSKQDVRAKNQVLGGATIRLRISHLDWFSREDQAGLPERSHSWLQASHLTAGTLNQAGTGCSAAWQVLGLWSNLDTVSGQGSSILKFHALLPHCAKTCSAGAHVQAPVLPLKQGPCRASGPAQAAVGIRPPAAGTVPHQWYPSPQVHFLLSEQTLGSGLQLVASAFFHFIKLTPRLEGLGTTPQYPIYHFGFAVLR